MFETQPITLGRALRTIEAGPFVMVDCTYAPSLSLPRHGHEEPAFCFPLRGAFEEAIDGRRYWCEPYDVMVRPPAVRHANRYGRTGARCIVIAVPPDEIPRLPSATPLLGRGESLPRGDATSLAVRIAREMQTLDAASEIALEGLGLELVAASMRGPLRGSAPRWLAAARDYVHSHAEGRLALGDIARAAGVHPSNVVRAFRRYLRCTPGEYVRRLRLEKAREALLTSDRPIAAIALEAGFYDQSHFTAAFRRHFGVTPARFRAR